jgi:hypothetical protein
MFSTVVVRYDDEFMTSKVILDTIPLSMNSKLFYHKIPAGPRHRGARFAQSVQWQFCWQLPVGVLFVIKNQGARPLVVASTIATAHYDFTFKSTMV